MMEAWFLAGLVLGTSRPPEWSVAPLLAPTCRT